MKKLLVFVSMAISATFSSIGRAGDQTDYFPHPLAPGDPKIEALLNAPFDTKGTIFEAKALPNTCNSLLELSPRDSNEFADIHIRNERVVLFSRYLQCWSYRKFKDASSAEISFLGDRPLNSRNMTELHQWFEKKYQTTGLDEYLKFIQLPVFGTYSCETAINCSASSEADDASNRLPEYEVNVSLLSISDVNGDGIADATIQIEERVYGRANPPQALVFTRVAHGHGAQPLEIFPPWPRRWNGVGIPSIFED